MRWRVRILGKRERGDESGGVVEKRGEGEENCFNTSHTVFAHTMPHLAHLTISFEKPFSLGGDSLLSLPYKPPYNDDD